MRDVAILGTRASSLGQVQRQTGDRALPHRDRSGVGRRGHQVAGRRSCCRGEFAFLRRQGLGPQRQRPRRRHGVDRHPGLQHECWMLGWRQRFQRGTHDGRQRSARYRRGDGRRKDAQGFRADLGARRSNRPGIFAPTLRGFARPRILGASLSPAHGAVRND